MREQLGSLLLGRAGFDAPAIGQVRDVSLPFLVRLFRKFAARLISLDPFPG